MKKIMILGASILQLPAILKAKEMGLQVIAVDMDRNAIGFNDADICLEISTLDIPKVVTAAKRFNIDGIMTLASDLPMRTVAAVAKELNIIGINEDTALKATNKAIMRECLKKNHVPIPTFFRAYTLEDYTNSLKKFENKCIVKPADNSGSRGVYLINDIKDKSMVKFAFEYSKKHSQSGEIVVEEYMEGPEVSVETISIGNEVHVIQITDKLTTGAPRFVEMGHSQPSSLDDNTKEQIKAITKKAVKAIGMESGPSHTEIKVMKDGPKIVEIGARLGGDNITTHLVPLSTGVNMVEVSIRIALGEKPNLTKILNMGSAIRYFDTPKGTIKEISGVDEAKLIDGVKQISFVKNIGDQVGEINNSSDRAGFVIAQEETAEYAVLVCNKVIETIDIEIEA